MHARVYTREGEREIEKEGNEREREQRRERNGHRVTMRERQGTLRQMQSDMYRHRDRDEESQKRGQ